MKIEIQRIEGEFSIYKVDDVSEADLTKHYTFLATTDREISVVSRTDWVSQNAYTRDDGWALYGVKGPLDFSLIGILAGIADVLANMKMSIFVVSTYDTDYFMIKAENCTEAENELANAGYIILEPSVYSK